MDTDPPQEIRRRFGKKYACSFPEAQEAHPSFQLAYIDYLVPGTVLNTASEHHSLVG